MAQLISRRRFLIRSLEGTAASVLAGGVAALPAHPVQVAIAGFGRRGSALLASCAYPLFQVKAVCDRDVSVLRRAMAQVPSASAFTDFRRLLRDSEVHAIAIAAPGCEELAKQALMSGRHVFLMPSTPTSAAGALCLRRAALHRHVQFGLAPTDLSWDADELNSIFGALAAGNGEDGAIRMRIASPDSHGTVRGELPRVAWDVMHTLVRLIPNAAPRGVSVLRATTSLGTSCSVAFAFDGGRRSCDLHIEPGLDTPEGSMRIELEFRRPGGAIHAVIDSFLEAPSSRAGRRRIAGLKDFGIAVSQAAGGFAASTGHAFNVMFWSALLQDALRSGTGRAGLPASELA